MTYLTIEDLGDGCYDTAPHATLAAAVRYAFTIHMKAGNTPFGVKLDLRHTAIDLEPLVQEAIAEGLAERRCGAQDQEWRSS